MRKFFQDHWRKVLIVSCVVLVVGLFISTNQRFGATVSPSRVINFLSQLRDVTITSPSDTEVLSYDSASGKWINSTASGGGIANPFTENVSGGGFNLTNVGTVSSTLIKTSRGAVGTPAWSFSADTNTGLYSPSEDELAWSSGGTQIMTANASRLQMGGTGGAYLKRNISTYAAPVFSFAGNTGEGMGSLSSDNLFFSVLGSKVMEFTSTTAKTFRSTTVQPPTITTVGANDIAFTIEQEINDTSSTASGLLKFANIVIADTSAPTGYLYRFLNVHSNAFAADLYYINAVNGPNIFNTAVAGDIGLNASDDVALIAGDVVHSQTDMYISSSTQGIILKSPDGSCARGTIDNSDVFTFSSVTCPTVNSY